MQEPEIQYLAAAISRELHRGEVSPAYVDTRRAAVFLGISIAQLERWRSTGEGPRFVKYEKAVRYKLDDLESWADARRIGGDR